MHRKLGKKGDDTHQYMSVGSALIFHAYGIVHERAGVSTLNMLIEARLMGHMPHRYDSRTKVKVSPFKRFPPRGMSESPCDTRLGVSWIYHEYSFVSSGGGHQEGQSHKSPTIIQESHELRPTISSSGSRIHTTSVVCARTGKNHPVVVRTHLARVSRRDSVPVSSWCQGNLMMLLKHTDLC
jgi:hypothetical protein